LGPVLDSRAIVYLAANRLNEALKDINESLNAAETPLRFFHQAQIYSKLGQEPSARSAMFKALQHGLTKDMLQPAEMPSYENLKQLLKENK
jgi:cellulose synthase operon protein C